MATNLDQLIQQASQLPAAERVRMIQQLAETLVDVSARFPSKGLWRFGAFAGEKMSTEADFTVAEWHPSDEELNGR